MQRQVILLILLNFQQNGVSYFVVGAGGTTIQLGQAIDYPATNVLASFKSTVNSYNQVLIQNKSNGTSASANLVLIMIQVQILLSMVK